MGCSPFEYIAALFCSTSVTKLESATFNNGSFMARPCGPMDKASDFESEDCGFDPHHGQGFSVKASFRVTKVYSALITLYVRQAVRGS